MLRICTSLYGHVYLCKLIETIIAFVVVSRCSSIKVSSLPSNLALRRELSCSSILLRALVYAIEPDRWQRLDLEYKQSNQKANAVFEPGDNPLNEATHHPAVTTHEVTTSSLELDEYRHNDLINSEPNTRRDYTTSTRHQI